MSLIVHVELFTQKSTAIKSFKHHLMKYLMHARARSCMLMNAHARQCMLVHARERSPVSLAA